MAMRSGPIRLGAVDYLNAQPLVYGLERRPDLFVLQFDPPSRCATLLHEHAIDVGMIPTIEYCRGPEYSIVPDIGIVSDGPVASVAVFSNKPIGQVRTIAADTSSRTSNALLRVLCAEHLGIAPEFRPMPPNVEVMLASCDAALVIGDPALYFDAAAHGVAKIDLGEEWTKLTRLPFVWAFWAGRPGALATAMLAALATARDEGVAASDAIADEYCGATLAARGRAYLRDNIKYRMGERELAGLVTYYDLAARLGLVDAPRDVHFYRDDD